MTPETVAPVAQRRGFKKRSKVNFVRELDDVLQLVNLQKSNYSDEWYVNFALWPKTWGAPDRVVEHLFPLRGRIKSVIHLSGNVSAADLERFFDVVDNSFSSIESLKASLMRGELSRMYIDAKLKLLLGE